MVKPFTIKNGNLIICKLSNFHTKGARELFPDALPLSSVLSARIAFSIAITETPTSANTASHIFAIPAAPSMRTRALTARANTMFCFTILSVFLAILTTVAIFAGLSSIRTTSAASMAASEPMLPMAIPISALVSTGASLIPSPTKASLRFSSRGSKSISTLSTLSPGSSSV